MLDRVSSKNSCEGRIEGFMRGSRKDRVTSDKKKYSTLGRTHPISHSHAMAMHQTGLPRRAPNKPVFSSPLSHSLISLFCCTSSSRTHNIKDLHHLYLEQGVTLPRSPDPTASTTPLKPHLCCTSHPRTHNISP